MDKTLAMIAGPLLSAVALYFRYRKKNVGKWLKERRIDKKERSADTCELCGKPMKKRKSYTGQREGLTAMVCSQYPECRNVQWKGRN